MRVVEALAATVAVPTEAVAETPVTFTDTETDAESATREANGALAKGKKPNIVYFRLLSPSALEVYHFLRC